MAGTVVLREVQSVLDWEVREVLGAEGDDFLLRDEEGEFVLPGAVELAELDAGDFGADVGCGVFDDDAGFD